MGQSTTSVNHTDRSLFAEMSADDGKRTGTEC
jgi:hypothetical protein